MMAGPPMTQAMLEYLPSVWDLTGAAILVFLYLLWRA